MSQPVHMNNYEVLEATADLVLKNLFSRYEKSLNWLRDFLASVLEVPIDNITELSLVQTELTKEDVSSKGCRLDLCVKVNGKTVDIEMQRQNTPDLMKRLLFYWGTLYCQSAQAGSSYKDLPQVICICIVDFSVSASHNYHGTYKLRRDDNNEVLDESERIDILELPKVPKELLPSDRKQLWMRLFACKTEQDFIEMEKTGDPVMQEAVSRIRSMSSDEGMRFIAMCRKGADLERNTEILDAREKGRAEGKAEGRAEGIAEGEARGKAEGRAEGRVEGIASSVHSLMCQLHMSQEEAMAVLRVPPELRPLCTQLIAAGNFQ